MKTHIITAAPLLVAAGSLAQVRQTVNAQTRCKGTDPLQIANQTVSFSVNSGAATSPNARGNKEAADSEQLEMSKRQQHNNEAYARQRVEKQVDALGQLAKTLRAVPGRKQIILLSEGFDAKYLQGRDVRDTNAQNDETQAVLSGNSWMVDNDARYGNTASQTMLDRMAPLFRSARAGAHARATP